MRRMGRKNKTTLLSKCKDKWQMTLLLGRGGKGSSCGPASTRVAAATQVWADTAVELSATRSSHTFPKRCQQYEFLHEIS